MKKKCSVSPVCGIFYIRISKILVNFFLIKVHIIHAVVFPWHQSESKAMPMAPTVIPEWTNTNMSAMVSKCCLLTVAMSLQSTIVKIVCNGLNPTIVCAVLAPCSRLS